MRALLALMLVSRLAWGQDVPAPDAEPGPQELPPIVKISEPARLSVGFVTVDVPAPSYLFSGKAFDETNKELKRLQLIEMLPPKQVEVKVSATGFIIAVAVGLAAGLAGGAAITYVVMKKP